MGMAPLAYRSFIRSTHSTALSVSKVKASPWPFRIGTPIFCQSPGSRPLGSAMNAAYWPLDPAAIRSA